MSYTSLSGRWTGVYDYRAGLGEATPFEAELAEMAYALSGMIIEPNAFAPDAASELFATLAGHRSEREIEFVKTYQNLPSANYQIRYRGIVSPKLTRIDGEWTTFRGSKDIWSGPFVMNRPEPAVQRSAKSRKEVAR